jgi:16S rRNA processing protein RimM
MNYLKVGVIATTHGVRGGLKIHPMTDDHARFQELKWVYMEGSEKKWKIKEVKIRPKDVIMYLEGLDTMNDAEPLRGKYLYTDETQRKPLEEDRHYVSDLIGLHVHLTDGTKVGVLSEVLTTGAHDVYVVTSSDEKNQWMIPAVKDFIISISLEDRKIIIDPIEGMLS